MLESLSLGISLEDLEEVSEVREVRASKMPPTTWCCIKWQKVDGWMAYQIDKRTT